MSCTLNSNPLASRGRARAATVLASLGCLLPGWPTTGKAVEPLAAVVAGDVEIDVRLLSGRRFSATVDPRSDADTLWLRFGGERAALLRPVRWSSVEQLQVSERPLDLSDLRQAVLARRGARDPGDKPTRDKPNRVLQPPALVHREIPAHQEFSATFQAATNRGPSPETGRPVVPRVRSVAVDATVANWDGDVEADGLLVYIQPLDEVGDLLPVRGDVSFDLVGNHPSVIYQPQPLAPLARWARRVRPASVTARGIAFKLPFQALHPDLQTNVGPYALLHCRLAVPGHGTFDETVAVRIRQANPLRDQLQKLTGSRFHPQEWLGRTR